MNNPSKARRRYAEDTEVSVEKSQAEVKKLLLDFGCERFMTSEDAANWIIIFSSHGPSSDAPAPDAPPARMFRLVVRRPHPEDHDICFTEGGLDRPLARRRSALEQAGRQRWRGLVLRVKAKLESIIAGDSTLESEFLADLLLPNGQTVGQWIAPQIEEAQKSAKMPLLLGTGISGPQP